VAAAGAHLPVTVSQTAPWAQSADERHEVLHRPLLVSQVYGGQFFVLGVAQLPDPSQTPPGCDTSPVHVAGLHDLAIPG
jgi:hypothetical protein